MRMPRLGCYGSARVQSVHDRTDSEPLFWDAIRADPGPRRPGARARFDTGKYDTNRYLVPLLAPQRTEHNVCSP